MVKLNSEGDVLWERQYSYLEYPGAVRESSYFQGDFQPTPDEGFIVTGVAFNQIDSFNYNQDIWLLKLDSNGCLGPDSCGVAVGIKEIRMNKSSATIITYPNPFTSQALVSIKANSAEYANEKIQFQLFDVSGRLLQTNSHTLNQYGYCEFYVEREYYPAGIYFYQVTTQKNVLGKGKLVIR